MPGRWHESVNLGLLGQKALLLMDGRHSVAQVKQGLFDAIKRENLRLTDSHGREVHVASEQRKRIDDFVEDQLRRFRRHGLLLTQ